MGKIESIQQKIYQLDAGSFQNLCNSYLCRIGYQNIVSLGGEAGTRKTTLGTPDAYFTDSDGRYIFVECTTQKSSVFSKIKNDLAKCLDTAKTEIPHDRISEIIYCHTSSNLTPSQDSEIKSLCKEVGIKLTVIGIDQLAEDIYFLYPILARDFLDISISTEQIHSFDDFIKFYNLNKLAAPIDTEFFSREKELTDINESFQKSDVVILSGAAGTGKTRLALHYTENRKKVIGEKVFCIHSNALPIFEDLKLFIDSPGNYFLFVDDANQLSGLHHVIRYVNMKSEGYNVKILITVRDYAYQKVVRNIQEIASHEVVRINVFSDDELRKLLENSLDILNSEYQERIIKISEGNARIAILAGKVACDSNRLDSINDVSQLFEDYYGSALEETQLLINNNMCIAAGVVAFLEAIHLDHIDDILPILQEKGLTRDSFIENVRMLHDQEIVDIYHDKTVRFSEQCLSNYLLKYVFFDKKLLSLSGMIKVCFLSYRERTISSVNVLLNIFGNEDLFNFVEKEIKKIWDDLVKEKSPQFFEFVKVFFQINPTETLVILKNKIESEEVVPCECSDINTAKGKNYQSVTNDIIKILGGFDDMNNLPTACDLFFQYYLKRPDLYWEFYHAANLYFGIRKESICFDFFKQITFFDKIKEYSNDWKQESVVILFCEIAENFLKLYFSPMEEGRKNTLIIRQIPLTISEGVKKYRMLIWEFLTSLCKTEKYKSRVKKILSTYGGTVKGVSVPVLQFDLEFIVLILKSNFPPAELENCLIAERIANIFEGKNISCALLFADYFEQEDFQLYILLREVDLYKGIDIEEYEKRRLQPIENFVLTCDLETFKKIIDISDRDLALDGRIFWGVGEGLAIAFDIISHKKDFYVDAIQYYIKSDTPCNLSPERLIKNLFSLLNDLEVYQIITGEEYRQKNAWLYAYFHELPPESVNEDHLQRLYTFLEDTSDKNVTSSSMRDVEFLFKYLSIDNQVFEKGCKIILSKAEYSPFIVHIYFCLLFNSHHNSPQEVISKFNGNLELLEEIYCSMLSCENHHDHDGRFLKEIYSVRHTILDKYIGYLVEKNSSFSDHQERHCCFFDSCDFIEIYNKIFDQLVMNCPVPKISVSFLESILLPTQEDQGLMAKQDEWIQQCIRLFCKDKIKMYCLFSAVSKFEIERKKEYIFLFLEMNPLFEDFTRIPLTPISYSWTGSPVPIYSGWIEFFESLRPKLLGLKWLEHKQYVEKKIDSLKREIESEQINEILKG